MFEKVKDFLEEADRQGVSEKEFDDYSRNYIKTHSGSSCGSIAVANEDWFDKISNDPNWIVLYRGISHKLFADRALSGEVYIGGPVRGLYFPSNFAQLGNGIYLTSVFDHAKEYARICDFVNGDRNQLYGYVIKFALPLNSKFVSPYYLDGVFNKMVEKHPDYSYFKKYKDLCKIYGDGNFMAFSSGFDVIADYVKRKTGFDFFADVDKKSAKERYELFNKVYEGYFKFDENGNNISESEKKKRLQEFEDFVLKYPSFFGQNAYITDKVYFLSRNIGLLASFLDFDVVYNYVPGVFVSSFSESALDVAKNQESRTEIDEFNVVDYRNLVVCSEPADSKARIRWGETIIL